MQRYWDQGRSHNLKEVPQNFTEVFNINGVTANDVIQRNQHRQEKKINLSSILITDVKLALQLKKDSEFRFTFLRQEHCHSQIPGAWLACMLASLYYFDKKFTAHFQPIFTFSKYECSKVNKKGTSKTKVNRRGRNNSQSTDMTGQFNSRILYYYRNDRSFFLSSTTGYVFGIDTSKRQKKI